MIKITFITADGAEHVTEGRAGLSLMEVARMADVPGILAECGGACSCSTCHVHVDPGWVAQLPEKDEMEADLLDFASDVDEATSRLSCQITVTVDMDGLRVSIPAEQG
ncbi:2Fe-2S iron-sulfur cluster binding domain-containing protein [Maritalea mobilis]|uniref:2Fe-2S iron-sulfur cluster-binding protein n=1 Tax=Maritalea mobilis TaxID=483324 RepID=UPI001C9749DD|nr:2Fe-2S iron-sulfur cluster-binding protein [Maritalea mobilis]MBY6200988.1 2Fe-2S iron-sulfur cluster binding domain-containing protein [Maritalea mobilis]